MGRNTLSRLRGVSAILLPLFTGFSLLLILSGSAGSSTASPPSVAITSPTSNSTVKGTVTVTASATAGAGDYMSKISIYDGANHVGDGDCNDQPSCVVSVQWKATGLSGQHSLTAKAYSEEGLSTTSVAVPVNVESPPPTVTVTSPAAGSKVSGKISVNVSAATDPSQDDYPTSVSVYDGVKSIGSFDCQGQQTCEGSVTWETTGMSGQHTLTVKVHTNNGVSATSAPVDVQVVSPGPTVKITSPRAGVRLGRVITIRAFGQTNPTQTDYPTSIDIYDGTNSIGSIDCQGQQTCGGSVKWDARDLKGRHKLTAQIHTDTGRSATSAPVVVGEAVKRHVSPHCTLSTFKARRHQPVHGQCTVKGVATGTTISILYRIGASFQTAVRGRIGSSGLYRFTLRATRKAAFDLWVVVSATSRTKAARVRIGTLQIS
jgi:hypothetical protein